MPSRHLVFAALAALPLLAARPPALAAPPAADRLATDQGDLVIHAVSHASFVMQWNGKTIAVDPVGGAAAFASFPKADLVLITDIHGDHLDPATIAAVASETAVLAAPAAVREQLPEALAAKTTQLANGQKTEKLGLVIEALPMYNTTPERQRFHPKGRGNGYLLELGGKRIYIAGDTEDIPEMRALRNIDAAFLCMNLPYTMDVDSAASAVRQFRPKVVYPYHYRSGGGQMSDLERFRSLVGTDRGVEVRLLNWYP